MRGGSLLFVLTIGKAAPLDYSRRTMRSLRLAKDLKPERYRLRLKPDFRTFSFGGEEVIHFALARPVSELALHAKGLKIESVELKQGKIHLRPKKITYDERKETVRFSFREKLAKGSAELALRFSGTLNDQMRGFYRSRYTVKGKEKYLATTQFEATDARRAFPCIDEPAAKAVFEVSLVIPDDCTAISNTDEREVTAAGPGLKLIRFAPTPKMSTYLLAFVVGEFEFLEGRTNEGVRVRVYTTPGKREQAKFALEVAQKTLSFYTGYFGVKYPLPKLDMIAIPDFAAGAMENWGAVTYRESAILVDEKNSSTATRQGVALVVAHELAHQWFGNLVTMEWWTHLWLNEGFASWIEYLAVDHLFPDWDIWTQFVHQDLASALHLDALRHTHPIEVEVKNPAEIGEIFDAVSYSKGASIIRMLSEYLGEEKFRKGLKRYLKRHQYGNAATADLWKALSEVSRRPVGRMMRNWTGKAGYPVLTVTEKGKNFELRQERFFASARRARSLHDRTLWSIPLDSISPDRKEQRKTLMERRSMSLINPSREWTKFDAGAAGVYRVAYSGKLLARLQSALGNTRLTARDRFQLINDAFALAESGRLPTAEALALARHYRDEADYSVWADLAGDIGRVHTLLEEESFLPAYREFARALFQNLAGRMGWEKRAGERHTDPLLRSLALYNFGFYGDRDTVRKAQDLFRGLVKGRTIDPDLRGAAYLLAAEHGEKAEHQRFIRLYREAELHEEKNRLGRALGHFRDPELIETTLQFALSKDVRLQDAIGIINAAWSSPKGKILAWKFVREHWEILLKRYGEGGHLLPRLIQPAGSFHTEARAKEVERFFKAHKAPGAERTIRQVLERIYIHYDWLSRDREAVRRWLEEK